MPVVVGLYLLMAIFREKVKHLVFKELRELEHEAKVLEKDVEKEVEWMEEEVGMKKKSVIGKRPRKSRLKNKKS